MDECTILLKYVADGTDIRWIHWYNTEKREFEELFDCRKCCKNDKILLILFIPEITQATSSYSVKR